MRRLTISILVIFILIPLHAIAAECVWTGAVSESFSEALNWSCGAVPTALDVVVHSSLPGGGSDSLFEDGAVGGRVAGVDGGHVKGVGHLRIRVDMDAHIDSLVVDGGGGRSLVVDDDCSLVVRKGITNRRGITSGHGITNRRGALNGDVDVDYELTVRKVGNLFVGGEVGANVVVDRERDRIPFEMLL